MTALGWKRTTTVSRCGARAGEVLLGCGMSNQGLRLRVSRGQARGGSGPVVGPFVILDTGDNKHSAALEPLVGLETDAAEVTAFIRVSHPGCVGVANLNILAPEGPR